MYPIAICCFCHEDFEYDPVELPPACPACGMLLEWDWDTDPESFVGIWHWPVPPGEG